MIFIKIRDLCFWFKLKTRLNLQLMLSICFPAMYHCSINEGTLTKVYFHRGALPLGVVGLWPPRYVDFALNQHFKLFYSSFWPCIGLVWEISAQPPILRGRRFSASRGFRPIGFRPRLFSSNRFSARGFRPICFRPICFRPICFRPICFRPIGFRPRLLSAKSFGQDFQPTIFWSKLLLPKISPNSKA